MFSALLLTLFALRMTPQTASQSPAATSFHARLSLPDGKAVFKQGEPIRLVLSLTSDVYGYSIRSGPESVHITPDGGVFHWRERYEEEEGPGGSDVVSVQELSTTPLLWPVTVNDWFRFDRPGYFTVTVRVCCIVTKGTELSPSDRVSIESTPVSFAVTPMTEEEESAMVRQLAAAANATETDMEPFRQLTYLPGTAAAHELVRQFVRARGQSSIGGTVWSGFYISRSPSVILEDFEKLLADVSQPAEWSWVSEAIAMRKWIDRLAGRRKDPPRGGGGLLAMPPPLIDPTADAVIGTLAATLDQRTGESRRETAVEVITAQQTYDGQRPPANAVQIVVEEFDALSHDVQEWLVNAFWFSIRDPRLAPSLRRLLASGGHSTGEQLSALLDVAPAEGREAVIAEIRKTQSEASVGVLTALPDESLPSLDRELLDSVAAALAAPAAPGILQLRQEDRVVLLARYGSSAIADEVYALYIDHEKVLREATKGHLLAYLVKRDEIRSRPLIVRAIDSGRNTSGVLSAVTQYAYSPTLDAIVRKRLEEDDPLVAGDAARILSRLGPRESRDLLHARLDRWLAEWTPNRARLELEEGAGREQAALQTQLILALIYGRSWKLTDLEAEALGRTCLTSRCRSQFVVGK